MHVTDIDNPLPRFVCFASTAADYCRTFGIQHSTFYKETKKSRMKDFY